MKPDAIGLDIGGANIKAATSSGEALSRRFELWKHPERLSEALTEISKQLSESDRIAVTMTGELCDCFHTKREGVRRILASVTEVFPKEHVRVWSTTGRFVTIDEANASHMAVAAANWHAQGTYVAGYFRPERNLARILVDCGSTTTDVVAIYRRGCYLAHLTDTERLQSRELVYTGIRRTPICALITDKVASEFFATAQDAYLLLDQTAENANDLQTADGKPATKKFAHARMARMFGGDAEITPLEMTIELANRVFTAQRSMIVEAISAAASRLPNVQVSILHSGSGEFLGRAAAQQFADLAQNSGSPTIIESLSEAWGTERSTAACAYSLAMLAQVMPW